MEPEKKSNTFQIIVFKQGNEEYALHIDQIKEVVLTPAITRMPQTPPYIKGVANIRGNIIAIVDLEEKFGLKQLQENPSGGNYTLVVESDEFKMGVLVREVPNTLAISETDLDQHVLGSSESDQHYIKGIVKLGQRLIILIDIFKILSTKEINHTLQKQA